jgi:hypothetical protein
MSVDGTELSGAEKMIDRNIDELKNEIANHLQNTNYPPVTLDLIDSCIEAIRLAEDKKWDHLVKLPDSVKFNGAEYATVNDIIAGQRLEKWLDVSDHAQTFGAN